MRTGGAGTHYFRTQGWLIFLMLMFLHVVGDNNTKNNCLIICEFVTCSLVQCFDFSAFLFRMLLFTSSCFLWLWSTHVILPIYFISTLPSIHIKSPDMLFVVYILTLQWLLRFLNNTCVIYFYKLRSLKNISSFKYVIDPCILIIRWCVEIFSARRKSVLTSGFIFKITFLSCR